MFEPAHIRRMADNARAGPGSRAGKVAAACAVLPPSRHCCQRHVALDGVPGFFRDLIPDVVEGVRDRLPDNPQPARPH